LKTCPQCSTINSDDSLNCGVCGTGLSSTTPVTLEAAESVAREQIENRRPLNLAGRRSGKIVLVCILSGVGSTVTGVILFPIVKSLWPIFLIIPGAILILSGLDSLSQTGLRPTFRGFGLRAIKDESERQEIEERKIESGEAD
jgi:hypothetical protein